VQRRTHDPIDSTSGGRLDALGATPRQQLIADVFTATFDLRDVADQPFGEFVRVRDAALPKAQREPDLAAMELDRAPGPFVER
jgi:hypothetical protein